MFTGPRLQRLTRFRVASLTMLATAAFLTGCSETKQTADSASGSARHHEVGLADYAGSQSCRECHAAAFDAWSGSNHAFAERPLTSELDQEAFSHPEVITQTSDPTRVSWGDDGASYTVDADSEEAHEYRPVRAFGHDPLRQYLMEIEPGRLQAAELAYDPHNHEWFNVFGDENREVGEWGHWTGRGMNWNSMCATCHNTHLRKNYDSANDTYDTTMAEMGVSCEACHGPMKAHAEWRREHPESTAADPTLNRFTPNQTMETCATCHSRRSEITGAFVPGDHYHDHYLLTVPDQSDLFYPDGQVQAEDYVFTSFFSSKMHAAGVTCMDCHEPHTSRTILPGNDLCMRCHNGARQDSPVIDPVTHTFHQPTSEGAKCVSCHMPQTTYMQRHPRRDHGFTIPDPLLTIETGTPNACNRCHTDQSAEWANGFVEQWYGDRMNRPTRERARMVHAARQNDESVRQQLIDFLIDEPQPLWQATATRLLDQWLGDPAVNRVLTRSLTNASPLVRAHAVTSLDALAQVDPSVAGEIENLLDDESRSVRTMAAWVLRSSVESDSEAGSELLEMLDHGADQPTGLLKKGYYLIARGRIPEAISEIEKAIEWDPNSPPLHQELAVAYSMTGDIDAAIRSMRSAINLDPDEAEYRYRLALALSEKGDLNQAIAALREAVRLNDRHSRAWYNLGLALNQLGDPAGAVGALVRGETAAPHDPRIPYARATIHLQSGEIPQAQQAATRALEIQPDYAEAQNLLRSLGMR